MHFNNAVTAIVAQYSQARPDANRTVTYLQGSPGEGKSACARAALKKLGFGPQPDGTGLPLVEFTPSLRDPVDVLGTPNNNGEFTKWVPPEEFYKLRKGVGKCALLIEELSDATVPMQNAMCGVIYDRRAGNLELSDELIIVATGNRTEDKSGANRVTSKLAGRVRVLDFEAKLDEIIGYAIDNDWPEMLPAFFRFKPDAVSAFDANRFSNPTPRTWEDVARMPVGLPRELALEMMSGAVGAAAATEYMAFCDLFGQLPDPREAIANPTKCIVPSEPAARYAMMGAVAKLAANKNDIGNGYIYAKRLDPEYLVCFMTDAYRRNKEISATAAFSEYANEFAGKI